MISIQYLNIRLGEERSSAHEISGNRELLALWAIFNNVYIGTTDSLTEDLALWIWFTITVAVCWLAVSVDASPRFSCSSASATRCPFAINNSFRIIILYGYLNWIILQRTYIGLFEQPSARTCWRFKLFVYSIQSFNGWCCMSGVCTNLLIMGKRYYSRVQGLAHILFLHNTSSIRV